MLNSLQHMFTPNFCLFGLGGWTIPQIELPTINLTWFRCVVKTIARALGSTPQMIAAGMSFYWRFLKVHVNYYFITGIPVTERMVVVAEIMPAKTVGFVFSVILKSCSFEYMRMVLSCQIGPRNCCCLTLNKNELGCWE